jgi:Domain of unknown function (DUF4232)
MRIIAAAAAVSALLALAGCGTTTTTVTAASGTTTAASTSASSTQTTPTTSSSATTTTATTTAAALPLCRASGLSLSFLGQQGATGHGLLGFAMRNTTSATCHTFGFPGVLWLSKSGAPLPTISLRTTLDFFGHAPLHSINLPPGDVVSFRLGVTHGVTSTAQCTTAAALQVIPPNDTGTLRITIPQGAYECRTTTISPVQPGTTAYH